MKQEDRGNVLALSTESGVISDDDRSYFLRLGKRIAQLRNRQALTQTQLAEVLEVSQKSINAFEHGVRRLPVSLLPPLAQALDVSIEDLVADGAPRKTGKRGPLSKIEQQMDLIRRLPRARQKIIIDMLDGVLSHAERASNS